MDEAMRIRDKIWYRKIMRTATRQQLEAELQEKIDRGETDPEAAMVRELKEETGYTADQIRYLGCINPSVGYSEEVIHLYLMTGLVPGEQKLDDDEALEVELMPFDEVCRMAEGGKLSDAKTVAGVLMARAQR